MIEVTALIEGTGSGPQWAAHWRRASAIGSNFNGMRGAKPRTPSEHGRLGVGAPDRLQRLDHLALGGVRPRAVEQQWHQVRLAAGGLAQCREGPLRRGA